MITLLRTISFKLVIRILLLSSILTFSLSSQLMSETASSISEDAVLSRSLISASIPNLPPANVVGQIDKHDTLSWRGIPYAAPPVGNLRWRAPRNPKKWSGNRQAMRFGNICPQKSNIYLGLNKEGGFNQPIGNEDCLYLNVWRPRSDETNLPVLFFIHGGSNILGSSSQYSYNGASFSQKANAVVVTINYRLGSLGWLFNEILTDGDSKDNSGNYGTLDLIHGLKWVRDNIKAFGGDPSTITVAGQSAGCVNTWALLLSPLAEGLIDRALCMTGIPLLYSKEKGHKHSNQLIDELLIDQGHAKNKAKATQIRQESSSSWLQAFLRNIPAETIVRLTSSVVPVHFNDGHVLPEKGYRKLFFGKYERIPMILSTTKNEGTFFAGKFLGYYNIDDETLWHMANYQNPNEVKLTDVMSDFETLSYPLVHSLVTKSFDTLIDIFTNVANGSQPEINVYRFHFDWDNLPGGWKKILGAMHGIEIPFLFGNFPEKNTLDLSRIMATEETQVERAELSNQFIRYVAQFMRNGNPNRPSDGLLDWPSWSNKANGRLVFDSEIYTSSR